MSTELHLSVVGLPTSEYDERAKLAGALRKELRATNVDARHPPAPAREGTKGSELEWAQLVVAGGTLPALIAAIRSWMGRRPGVEIRIVIHGDEITIVEPTDAERDRLVEAWIRQHEHE